MKKFNDHQATYYINSNVSFFCRLLCFPLYMHNTVCVVVEPTKHFRYTLGGGPAASHYKSH